MLVTLFKFSAGTLFYTHTKLYSLISSVPLQCLLFLEKELTTLGSMCAASLLRNDAVLSFAGVSNGAVYVCACMHVFV